MIPIDAVEAGEIANKVGWDKWDDSQKLANLLDHFSNRKPV
jgi:hypothetical protein